MELKRKLKLKNSILSHIISTIEGELLDWSSLKEWLSFDFQSKEEEDIAEKIFRNEADRLKKKIT